MTNKKCLCGKYSSFGKTDDKIPTCCKLCKLDGMIDLKHKKCKCGKHIPSFGNPDDKIPTCCKLCKTDDMIDIVNKKCKCGKLRPSFGKPDDKRPTCCSKCKTDGMINLINKKCNCGKSRPSFGNIEDKLPTCCKLCKLNGMIDIVSKKCNCGKSQPSFGNIEDKLPTCCKLCKLDCMIDLKHKKCNCGKSRPSFGNIEDKLPTCCKLCKLDGMINLKHKRCKSKNCDTRANDKYKGYCAFCYVNLFPEDKLSRNYKTKEFTVKDFLYEKFPHYTWINDKRIQNGCSSKRPDFIVDFGYFVLIVEVDENNHSDYDTSCENQRLMILSQDIGHRPMVMIRFNPDSYKNKENKKVKSPWVAHKSTGILLINNKKEWNHRLTILEETVDKWSKIGTDMMVKVIYLFNDEC